MYFLIFLPRINKDYLCYKNRKEKDCISSHPSERLLKLFLSLSGEGVPGPAGIHSRLLELLPDFPAEPQLPLAWIRPSVRISSTSARLFPNIASPPSSRLHPVTSSRFLLVPWSWKAKALFPDSFDAIVRAAI